MSTPGAAGGERPAGVTEITELAEISAADLTAPDAGRPADPAAAVAADLVSGPAAPPEAESGRSARGAGGPRSMWMSVIRSAGVKILVLPISAILGIVNVRLIIENYGQAAFAQYGLLVALGSLLPFADLGISAAVMNVVGQSENPRTDERVHLMLVSTLRILVGSCVVLLSIAATITVLGWWPAIMGAGLDPETGPMVAAMCLSTIAVSLLFGFSQRILAGVGRNDLSIGLLGLQTPIVLGILLVVTQTDSPIGPYIAVIPYLATLLIQIVTTVIANRFVHPMLGRAVRDAPRIRTVRGGRVFDVAWPMMIQMIALPVAMQTDRLVLSHVSTTTELARYNLASQMFTPVWQVVSAAGFALWPIFAKQRARREGGSPVPISFVFGAAAAVVSLVIALVSPWLADLASGGEIQLPLLLVMAFSVLMVFQALKYPLGMFMTDARGLRYQAYCILAMVPVNLGLSIALAGSLGAAGPVIGSVVGVVLFQYAANLLYVRRHRASGGPAS